MKKLLACVVCLALSVLIAAAGDAGKAPKIEGAWNVTGGSRNGEKLTNDFLEKTMFVFTFKSGKYTLKGKGGQEVQAGTYKLEAKGKAIHLDLYFTNDGDKEVRLGIMKLEGDLMTIASSTAVDKGEKGRPKNFDAGKDIDVLIMKRGK